jgi:hypothetical protein
MNTPIIVFNFTNSSITNADTGLRTITVDDARLNENLNPKQLNENKFFGSIADYFSRNDVIVVPCDNGNSFINKGNNKVIGEIKWRLKLDKNYVPNCITVGLPKSAAVWYTKDNNCFRCPDLDEFRTKMATVTVDASNVLAFGGKVTCGLVCQTEDNKVGHVTVAYNITSTESDELLTKYGTPNIGSIIPSKEIKFSTVNGDKIAPGGSVISLPSLTIEGVAHSHITCNSTIKAVLSAKIVEQYEAGIFEFPLASIDPSCKQPTIIKIDKDATDLNIKVREWYCYYLN